MALPGRVLGRRARLLQDRRTGRLLGEALTAPNGRNHGAIHDRTLPGGLRVVVRPVHAAPVAAIYLWSTVGSAHEREGEYGAAHLLEHMLFKGTRARGLGVAAAEIEGMGGDLNAFTSLHETVLHANVEASSWRAALDVVADMVLDPTIDARELERERTVVLEEIRGDEDDPDAVVEEAALAALFPDHPYGRSVTGTAASVAHLDRDTLVRFWRRAWDPTRCVLAIAGDVDPDEVHAVVAARLGGWTSQGEPLPDIAAAATVRGPLRVQPRRRFETISTQIAWRTLPTAHPDAAALDVLTAALGDGASALLVARMQLHDEVATDVWANLATLPADGYLGIGFLPRAGETRNAITTALDVVHQVRTRGLSGTALQRAKDSILASFLFSDETVDSLAHDLAWYTARYARPDARVDYETRLAAVTHDDALRVARTWLTPERLVVCALDSTVEPPALERVVGKACKPLATRRQGPSTHTIGHGVRLLVLPDDGAVAAVHAVGLGGGLYVEPRHAGIATAWARTVTEGTGDHDAAEFGEALDDLAATFSADTGPSTVALSATFPAFHVDAGLDLFGEALVDPAFAQEDWERVRDEMAEELDTLVDRPRTVASMATWEAWYRGHPWRLPDEGTPRSLDRIGSRALRAWHDRLMTAENLVIAVAGGVDADDVVQRLTPWLKRLRAGRFELPPRPAVLPPLHKSLARRAGREQALVLRTFRGPATSDRDRRALQLAIAALDGQGGRLFMELRERQSLAYAVWAGVTSGLDGGLVRIGLATDPDRVDEARTALTREVRRLIEEPLDVGEVERCRRMLVGEAAMHAQRAAARAEVAARAARLGVDGSVPALRELLGGIDAAGVQAAVDRWLGGATVEVTVEPIR